MIMEVLKQLGAASGLDFYFPGDDRKALGRSRGEIDDDALRLDLDDMGGEVCLLDWGRMKYRTPAVSMPNQNFRQYELMNGSIDAYLYQESEVLTAPDPQLYH